MATFLITGVGGPAGKSLSEQLKERGHSVVGVDMVEIAGALQGPRADSPELIPFLIRVVKEHSIDIFIPTVQDELPFVAAAAPIFPCAVVLSDASAVGIAHDKWLTAQFCLSRGLSVPETVTGTELFDEFPAVIKPRVARGGRGVVVVDTQDNLPADRDAALIIQSFAPGDEFCPQLYIPADGEITCVVLKKTKLREGRVGNADAVERTEHAEVSELATRIARELGLSGPIDMDIRMDRNNQPVLLEINARFGANSAHAPEILEALLREAQ
ncbi:ATP-grasp domain-containing protein [Corynebacterium breve]|uniref:ATP-grasp domain-containing protein n=1 Tax=Corynebacterium breve TaxID=3049799 RepID=A0ABY8VGL9_9CORY|nr:ATP-grasp domain-containing protein [Corynebacterium breve]WIM68654.1 ATP-grasp domain-containing protein [Corynebacterium breve]